VNAIHDGESATLKEFSFGSVQIDGRTCEHDVVIDRRKIRKRKKNHPSNFANSSATRRCPLRKTLPWKCSQLVIGTGAYGKRGDRQVDCTVIGHLTLHLNAA
jgi:hypothetical protein